MAIKIGNMAKEIMKQLGEYSIEVGLQVDKVSREVAEDTAKLLNQTSPVRTGEYARSWTSDKGVMKRNKTSYVVHAENKQYRLTHLLEKGHQLKRGGRSIGTVRAHEHIAPAEAVAITKLQEKLSRRL